MEELARRRVEARDRVVRAAGRARHVAAALSRPLERAGPVPAPQQGPRGGRRERHFDAAPLSAKDAPATSALSLMVTVLLCSSLPVVASKRATALSVLAPALVTLPAAAHIARGAVRDLQQGARAALVRRQRERGAARVRPVPLRLHRL